MAQPHTDLYVYDDSIDEEGLYAYLPNPHMQNNDGKPQQDLKFDNKNQYDYNNHSDYNFGL
jgi:hypothetical protein